MKPIQLLLFFLILPLLPATLYAKQDEVVVITHSSMPSLSKRELQLIYTGKLKTWDNGTPVRAYTFAPNTPAFRQFSLQKLKLQPHQIERQWNRMIFTGTGRAPLKVSSTEEMKQKVINTPGAIGYLPVSAYIAQQDTLKVN